MQYHENGVRPGNPAIRPENPAKGSNTQVDVLVVGCGPAGLTLATQLSRFADINVRIIERKSGPLEFGQADGLACRSLEMFEAFDFAGKVIQEAYQVNEVTFWRPGEDGTGLARISRIPDVEEGLSEMPHVILSQARVHDFYLEQMAQSANRLVPDYECELVGLERDEEAPYPVTATIVRSGDTANEETIRARYVVGCDGARSRVRQQMGLKLEGESARQLWGVMDVLAATDFPDIRLKCAIQSKDEGSMLIIPREGGFLVRMYIELDELAGSERAADRNLTAEILTAKAAAILQPYSLEVKQVSWWSAYEIGQRVCSRFDDADRFETPRVFIAGDACHTHSPKAGQGMNVSMADAFNLGWKLASVIRKTALPGLLSTYSDERQAMARELIDFDRDMARLFSIKPETEEEAIQFENYFRKHGRYTAGVETRYTASLICHPDTCQELAPGLAIGMRFHSAPVIRLADAKPMQLGHCMKADGRWRLVLFAPRGKMGLEVSERLARFLQHGEQSPLANHALDDDGGLPVDARVVFQEHHQQLEMAAVPEFYRPRTGKLGLTDYQKIFCADHLKGPDIFDARQINRQTGALVLVRPDQYVAAILNPSKPEALSPLLSDFCRPGKDPS